MAWTDLSRMTDTQLVRIITSCPDAAALVNEDVYLAYLELRHRHVQVRLPLTPTGRIRRAKSIEVDPARWRAACFKRRLTMQDLSDLAGKSKSWANMVMNHRRITYYTLDTLATELGETTEDLLYEIASDDERIRIHHSTIAIGGEA